MEKESLYIVNDPSQSLVMIIVNLRQRSPNEYKIWHTIVLTIFLLLDIVKRGLLIRVT